jgi:signal transduction histidine kinase
LIVIFFISRFFANKSIIPIKEAFDKQKQFIADASHELKTPLAVINTNVDVLLSNGEDAINTQSKWLHYIKSEVERMTKLTNDLLYLTQVNYSDIKMIYSDFNMSDTVESIILTMEAVIYENDILLDYSIEPNLTIYGNSEQIKQVVMILLDNALKYTDPNGNINLNLKREYSNIVLSLTNTGEGIPEEHLDKIFDRFYRIDKSRSRNSGGYGLGLAIAKTIVEQHGGKISVKSILNGSTTFKVELPIK